jgi:hypothetical protein
MMRDETLSVLLDVLDDLNERCKTCAERIYELERVSLGEQEHKKYLKARVKVLGESLDDGLDSEKWRQSAARVHELLSELRKKILSASR